MELKLTDETSIVSALSDNGIQKIKDELQKNVEFSKTLIITDLEDKKQIKIVKDTKNWYVKSRGTIERAFKSKRDEYNKLAAENLVAQREVIWVISDEETRLNDLVKKAELQKLKKDNALLLVDRIDALMKCDYELSEDLLLVMTEKDFEELLTDKRLAFVQLEEQRFEAKKLEAKRLEELEEAKKQARLQAEQEAEEKARLEKQKVEQDKIDAENKRKADLEKAEQDKQDAITKIKQDQESKELKEKQDKLDEEAKLKKEEAEKQAEKELMEKRKAFTDYRDSIDFDHFEDKDGIRIFYKKVWEFNI